MKKLIVLLMIILLMINTATAITLGAKPTATGAPPSAPAPTAAAQGPYYYVTTASTTVRAQGLDAGQTFSSTTLETAPNIRRIPPSTYTPLQNTPYTYTPATSTTPATITTITERPEDTGALADYKTTDTVTFTINSDGTTTSTLDRRTQVRSGLVRGDEDWQPGRREGQTIHYNRDGTINNVQTPVYPVTTDMLGQRTYAQTPAYYSRQDFSGPPEQKQVSSITLIDPATNLPYYRVNTADGSTMGRPELAANARTFAVMLADDSDRAQANYLRAEARASVADTAARAAQADVDAMQNAKKRGQAVEPQEESAAQTALTNAQTAAAKEKEKANEEFNKALDAESEAAAAETQAGELEAAKDQPLTSELAQGQGEARQEAADYALSWTASQKLRGFWGRFGLFMKAYDEFSGLRQYSAIGLGWYDEGVQKRRALYQQEFCLNAGIENCVTSQICGRVYPISADNVLAGAGPTGQYVTSGIINAERSIPIELEGMTRQQMIDLFGNTTVIAGRKINLTDPAFNPQILGRIKIWQYHVQYTLSNNAEPKRTMQHNVQFKRAQPGSTTSYGTPVKEAKWYPVDQTLESGVTATDQNLIWKYSATEYTDVCLTFEPSLPSKTKLVNHICTPFIEYAGGPTEVGAEIGAAPEAGAPAEQPGTFI